MTGIPRSSGEDLCYQMMQVGMFQIAGFIFLCRSGDPNLLERAACMTALDCTEWGACMHISAQSKISYYGSSGSDAMKIG